MILLQKWDYALHEYVPFESPAKHIAFMTDDMEAPTDCANCGKSMKFGDAYTSQQIHNHCGLGFPVCEDCYTIESELRRKH